MLLSPDPTVGDFIDVVFDGTVAAPGAKRLY